MRKEDKLKILEFEGLNFVFKNWEFEILQEILIFSQWKIRMIFLIPMSSVLLCI